MFLTHFHADFLAGHLELRNQAGAKIYLGARAKAEYEFIPLKGWRLSGVWKSQIDHPGDAGTLTRIDLISGI